MGMVMLRKIAFLLIAVPLVLLAVVLLLVNFGTMPKTDLITALALVILVAIVAMPAGITILAFAILTADPQRGRREHS
jgi:NADH:ubiquinone oxidoreductase subunit K